jgi:chitin elicitor receptor kinase 1
MQKVTPSATQADGASPSAGITVDRSVEFSYEELFNATEGFNLIHKIGQGGFGAVYYAELRGEVSFFFHLHFRNPHATNMYLTRGLNNGVRT